MLYRSVNSELLHRCLNLKKYCSMTKCSLSDNNISFVKKTKNPEMREISYLAHSTWNIHATEGKVDSYEGLPRNEKSNV